MGFYVSLEHRRKRPTHHPFNNLGRAQDFAVMQMYERDVMAYALCQVRRCKATKGKIVTLIDGRAKPEQAGVIRGVDGDVLLRY